MNQLAFVLIFLFQVTPTPSPTPSVQEQIQGISPTVEALQEQRNMTTDGEQVFDENGRPLLPNMQSAQFIQLVGMAKFVVDPAAGRGVFGPFYPIIFSFRAWITLSLSLLGFYFVQKAIVIVIRLIVFVVDNIIPSIILALIIVVALNIGRIMSWLGL